VGAERKQYQLPHDRFIGWADVDKTIPITQPIFLPDYVSLTFRANGNEYEVQVHPDRVELFLEGQRAINGEIEVL